MEPPEIQTLHSTTYPAILPQRLELTKIGIKNALMSGGGSGVEAMNNGKKISHPTSILVLRERNLVTRHSDLTNSTAGLANRS